MKETTTAITLLLAMSACVAADTPYGQHFGQVDPQLRDLDLAGP